MESKSELSVLASKPPTVILLGNEVPITRWGRTGTSINLVV
jgi:hypothetical protein